ncbi:MAG: hypothetical protein EZS26_002206 [Candidatus Ordinivivax streblomastigis]|uniref:Uncharacterized protein n=1 Tax=Candidatus Ordinivivax streblomastigis TaxID=2540710 RepID=A0A5M8NZP6_9BACT|nr:MAG: hypothetical protein EZS26_002206 [Candidatus Ordinivivax streblomastigis]
MISPEERKETIIFLKILQDEEKWDKIYSYVNRVLNETDEQEYSSSMVVREPVVPYQAAYQGEWLTEDEAQEILEDYEARKGVSKYSQEEMDSWIDIVEDCKAHPEKCCTMDELFQAMRAVYAVL